MYDALPILCLDFDGCIHLYSDGWRDGTIYDSAVPGFFDWAFKAQEKFQLAVYSSRSKDPGGINAIRRWMADEIVTAGYEKKDFNFNYPTQKPNLFLSIDDRTIRFDGDWNDIALDPEVMLQFKPWNRD